MTTPTKVLKLDGIRYVAFREIFQKEVEPKARRKMIGILECTITCLAKGDYDSVTMAAIARESGLTPKAIKYYFADIDELRLVSVMYARVIHQTVAIQATEGATSVEEYLERYVRASFAWVAERRNYALAWFSFLHRCCRHKKLKKTNSVAVRAGTERLSTLLQLKGGRDGVIAHRKARALQIFLTGALLSSETEDLDEAERDIFVQDVVSEILHLAQN